MTDEERFHCARCRIASVAISDPTFSDWETLTGDEMICPGCITLAEEVQIDDDLPADRCPACEGLSLIPIDDLADEIERRVFLSEERWACPCGHVEDRLS